MILETARLILRPWEETDAEACYQYASDPRVGPSAGWPVHQSVEDSREVIRNVLSRPETYAIVLRETGLPIGSIGLHHDDLAPGEDEAELGYWLGVPWWGQGIVPEAAREMLRHAFEDLHLKQVWCGYYEGNEKSRRVQEKLGFQHQWTSEHVPVPQLQEERTGHVNRMTREEWERHREIVYRRATEMDVETLIRMRIRQLREEGATEDMDLRPALRDYYLRHFSDGTFVSWIALDGERVIATSGMSFVEKPPYYGCPGGRIGLLSGMYTVPEFRRQGIARNLLEKVVEEARAYGCGTVQITASDAGVLLYTAFGFQKNSSFMQLPLKAKD